ESLDYRPSGNAFVRMRIRRISRAWSYWAFLRARRDLLSPSPVRGLDRSPETMMQGKMRQPSKQHPFPNCRGTINRLPAWFELDGEYAEGSIRRSPPGSTSAVQYSIPQEMQEHEQRVLYRRRHSRRYRRNNTHALRESDATATRLPGDKTRNSRQ